MKQPERESDFYLDCSNVSEYIEARRGLNGKILIDFLGSILEPGSTVLELGMGPGDDLLMLADTYSVVGSDYSPHFLSKFRVKHPEIELLLLDAVDISTTRSFDCVYSNKVLHHLSPDDLKASLLRQCEVVKRNGLIFHTFWRGSAKTTAGGLSFTKYRRDEITKLFATIGDVAGSGLYAELNQSDSFFVAARI